MKYQVGDIVKLVNPCSFVARPWRGCVFRVQSEARQWSDGVGHTCVHEPTGTEYHLMSWELEPYVGGTTRLQPTEEELDAVVAIGPLVHGPRPRFSTIPQEVLWDIAQVLTDGLTGGDDPTKLRGLYGWRQMQNEDPGGTEMTYFDSLMRHVRDGEWEKVAVNAIILADLKRHEER